MRHDLLLAGLLLLATPAAAQDAAPDDEALRRAWSFLLPEEQRDAAAQVAAETAALDSFQNRLVRHALELEAIDPGLLPEARPIPVFDPKVHAPKQPIPRRKLPPDDPRAKRQLERFLPPSARLPGWPAWVYDWGTGEVLRTADWEDPGLVFENALAGLPPRAALAEALVARALDDGTQRVPLAAFGHAYTDREGNVFPGLTLYDAWSSGADMEMPDVDVLGVVHDVLGERKRWKAPVPPRQHDALYAAVADAFGRARAHRALREALARTYLRGSPPLPEPYPLALERLHGLWEEHASMPAELARALPDVKGLEGFLGDWAMRYEKDAERIAKARARRGILERDAAQVRDFLVRALRERGAFEREARPPAPAAPGRPARGG